MSRRIPRLRIVICMLLGLLTTVGVSWAFALIRPDYRVAWDVVRPRVLERGEGTGFLRLQLLSAFAYRGYGGNPVADTRLQGLNCERLDPERVCPPWAREELLPWCAGIDPWPVPPQSDSRHIILTGWPLPCLYTAWSVRGNRTAAERAAFEARGWREWSGGVDGYVRGGIHWSNGDYLPLLPRPLPIVANSVFYSAFWFVLLPGPGLVLRALRRRPGCCARCGYDLRGLPPGSPCPECGGTASDARPVAVSA